MAWVKSCYTSVCYISEICHIIICEIQRCNWMHGWRRVLLKVKMISSCCLFTTMWVRIAKKDVVFCRIDISYFTSNAFAKYFSPLLFFAYTDKVDCSTHKCDVLDHVELCVCACAYLMECLNAWLCYLGTKRKSD